MILVGLVSKQFIDRYIIEGLLVGILRDSLKLPKLLSKAVLWVRVWKGLPVWPWLKAASAYSEGNYLLARDLYRKGLSKYASHPAHGSARLDLASCLEKLGYIDEAIQETSYIVSLRITNLEAYLMQSRLLSYLGKRRYALQTLEIAQEVFPQNIELVAKYTHLLLLGNISGSALEESISKLKSFLNTLSFESDLKVIVECALSHYELREGDFVAGENMLVRCLATGDAPIEAFMLRAELFLGSDRLIQAKEMFRRALEIDPKDPIPYIEMSRLYCNSEDIQDLEWGTQCAETACKLTQWKNLDAVAALVEAFRANGQFERANLLQDFFDQRVEEPLSLRAKA